MLEIFRGSFYLVGFGGLMFLIFSFFSIGFELSSDYRKLLFVVFILYGISGLIFWLILPLMKLMGWSPKRMSDHEAAKLIWTKDPVVGEKVINVLQLGEVRDNNFVVEALDHYRLKLRLFDFHEYMDKERLKKASWVLLPLILVLLGVFFTGNIDQLTEGSTRLIKYSEVYKAKDHVDFVFQGNDVVVEGEDYVVKVKLVSNVIVDDVSIEINGSTYSTKSIGNGVFESYVRNVEMDLSIICKSGRYVSQESSVRLIKTPKLLNYRLAVVPPSYTKIDSFSVASSNRFVIPENSLVTFEGMLMNVEELQMLANNDTVNAVADGDHLEYEIGFISNDQQIRVRSNKFDLNQFELSVIKDIYPKIQVDWFKDSLNENRYVAMGEISDDYGFHSLKLVFSQKAISIPIKRHVKNQRFYYEFELEDRVDHVRLEVRDNDKPNGYKITKSEEYRVYFLTLEEQQEQLNSSLSKTSSETKERLEKLKSPDINEANSDWKNEQELKDFKKDVESLKNLNKELKDDLEKDKKLNQKESDLQKELSERIKETDKELEDLLKKIEDLEKKVEKKEKDISEMKVSMEVSKQQLERTLELLEKLMLEKLVNETLEKVEKLQKEQEKLSNDKDNNELSKQEELNEQMEELKPLLEEIEQLDKENSENNTKESLDNAKKEGEKASESLKQGKKGKANQEQKKSSEELKKLQDELSDMQNALESETNMENLEDLKQLLKNIIKLSEEEEELIKGLRKLDQNDPGYVDLMKHQAKLKSDSRIISDSLNALIKRVPEIENDVLREMVRIDHYFNLSNDHLKNNKKDRAVGEMQYVMLSANNLALMLNNSMEQMQNMMQQKGKKSSGSKSCKNPGQSKPGMKGLMKMQQELQKEMEQQGKDPGKQKGKGSQGNRSGDAQELMQMMSRQEMIRMQLKDLGKESGGMDGNAELLKELEELMLENEKDLAERNFDGDFYERQKLIESKMLEAEQALMEREQDEKRVSRSNQEAYDKKREEALRKYILEKYGDVEGFNLDELDLSIFYKDKVK